MYMAACATMLPWAMLQLQWVSISMGFSTRVLQYALAMFYVSDQISPTVFKHIPMLLSLLQPSIGFVTYVTVR